jgi:acetyl-CoA C-acetyltransferase
LPGPLAEFCGAKPRFAYQTKYPGGDSPILLLNEAANRIAAGEIQSAAVVGGEALKTAMRAAAGQLGNAVRQAATRPAFSHRARYGLVAPVDVYPLYENALRPAWGQTLAQGQDETAEIWARFSAVAAANPAAWMGREVTAEDVRTATADNRPIAFPYLKLMVANSSVNQGAAFLVTSLAKALAAGVPEARLVYVGHGAAAHEASDFLARDRYDHSVSLETSLTQALAQNELAPADLDYAELYSCFPCIPKMARRVLGWPLEKPATLFGGLTFGGGPIGNYMSHAVASLVLALRERGTHGLLFANGGFATANHTIVLSRVPPPRAGTPSDFDFQAAADARRGPIPPLDEAYVGPGVIETYTVFYERDGTAKAGVIVGRAPGGARFLAQVPGQDGAAIAFLTDGAADPVGKAGLAVAGADGDVWWQQASP